MYSKDNSRTAFLSLLISMIFLFAACNNSVTSDSGSEQNDTADESPQGRVLNIYNWDTYIDPVILENFAAQYNITVNYETYGSNEELLEKLKETPGYYDIVVPTDYMVTIMRREGLLSPLRKEFIPNVGNLDSDLLNLAYDPANRYCLPYQWGTMGMGYNLEATGHELTSWEEMFASEFDDRTAILDDPRSSFGIALLLLGYSPNTTNLQEIAEAQTWLIDHLDQLGAITPDEGQDLLSAGEVDIVHEWSGDILQLIEENENIRYVIPDEGSIIWTDNICIPKDAPHQEFAELFINYLLRAEVGAALSDYIRYASPNEKSYPLINEADRNNPSIYPPEDVKKRLIYLVDLGIEMNTYYEDAWQEVLEVYQR